MAISFDFSSADGLKRLDEYLLKRSYITGCEASKDDLTVFWALASPPPSDLVNASRWYSHIKALFHYSFPGTPAGVSVNGAQAGAASIAPPAPRTPVPEEKAAEADAEDDDDLGLFSEETEEEKTAAAQRAAAAKSSSKKKESGKSSVLLDVKPWDDETDMVKLEAAVREIQMPGLVWGASKLVPVGYGIKKLQILMAIEDELVSVDELIEERLTEGPASEFIQSCDIVAFNKI